MSSRCLRREHHVAAERFAAGYRSSRKLIQPRTTLDESACDISDGVQTAGLHWFHPSHQSTCRTVAQPT